MKTCPSGHEVADDQRFCGTCGSEVGAAPAPAAAEPNAQDEAAKAAQSNARGCLWIFGILAAIVVFGMVVGNGGDDDSSSDGPDDYGAFEICKTFVKRDLKSPGTAEFRNFFEEDGEVSVTGFGDGPYTVRSSVDSQNGFGAQIRTNFTCTVQHVGGGEWRRISVVFDE